jgi:hypothetical protein
LPPSIILISVVDAEDILVNSLEVRTIIILISVTGNNAAPIPNRNSDGATSADVWLNIVTRKGMLI